MEPSSRRLTDVSAPWDDWNFTGTDFHSHSASGADVNTSGTENTEPAASMTKDQVIQQTRTVSQPTYLLAFVFQGLQEGLHQLAR